MAEVFDAKVTNPIAALAYDCGLVPLIGRSSMVIQVGDV
jgi:hypothetical protein